MIGVVCYSLSHFNFPQGRTNKQSIYMYGYLLGVATVRRPDIVYRVRRPDIYMYGFLLGVFVS